MVNYISYGAHLCSFDARSDRISNLIYSDTKSPISAISSLNGSVFNRHNGRFSSSDDNYFLLSANKHIMLMDRRFLKTQVSTKQTLHTCDSIKLIHNHSMASAGCIIHFFPNNIPRMIIFILETSDILLTASKNANQILFHTIEKDNDVDSCVESPIRLFHGATLPHGSFSSVPPLNY